MSLFIQELRNDITRSTGMSFAYKLHGSLLQYSRRIQPQHAVVENKDRKVFLTPCKGAKVTLNGNVIKEEKELHHNDRYKTTLFGFYRLIK